MYALKRLVRGLGSSHDAARQGFSLALAAALVKVPEIESLPALDMLDAALEVSKSTKVHACGYAPCFCRVIIWITLPFSYGACTAVLQHILPASARPTRFAMHRWLRVHTTGPELVPASAQRHSLAKLYLFYILPGRAGALAIVLATSRCVAFLIGSPVAVDR